MTLSTQAQVGEIVAVLGDAITLLSEPDPMPDHALTSVRQALLGIQRWRQTLLGDEQGEASYTGYTEIDTRNWVIESILWVLRADGDGYYDPAGAWYSQGLCLSHAEAMLRVVAEFLTKAP